MYYVRSEIEFTTDRAETEGEFDDFLDRITDELHELAGAAVPVIVDPKHDGQRR